MPKDRGWIQTYTGKRFWPLSPDKGEICIVDIAWALSNMPRFTGHTNRFYSVAEHSLKVAEHCPDELKLMGLMHDASEAYLCDIASPVKHHEEFKFYRGVEGILQTRIYREFGIEVSLADHAEVKRWDYLVTASEAMTLMAPLDPEFLDYVDKVIDKNLKGAELPIVSAELVSQRAIYQSFMDTYLTLSGKKS